MSLYETVHATTNWLTQQITTQPAVGIILGSGLGGLISAVEIEQQFPYTTIPNFPHSTVEGHVGSLIFGRLGNKQVVMMAGRFHYYEGYDMQQVTFPVRIMQALGVKTLFVSNAAGGTNANFKVGDLMLITDHINLFPEHPLRGPNDDRLGTRFPDMGQPYDKQITAMALEIAKEQGLHLHTGVYAGLTGPTYETRAEYKWLNIIGADAVGMSTVPEVIVAIHAGMKVFAASVITDLGIGENLGVITHGEVLEAANAAAPKLARLVTAIVERL